MTIDKKLRATCLLTPQERTYFNPVDFVDKMRAAGFEFESDVCPVKIKPPWTAVPQDNGDVLYSQWESP